MQSDTSADGDAAEATSAAEPDASNPVVQYRVGYGKPPLATRFRRGASGNPTGRPKGARNLASVVAATLGERVIVNEGGKRRRVTKLEAAVKQLVNRAAAGDARSLQVLIALVQASEARLSETTQNVPEAEDTLVLRELKRRLGQEA